MGLEPTSLAAYGPKPYAYTKIPPQGHKQYWTVKPVERGVPFAWYLLSYRLICKKQVSEEKVFILTAFVAPAGFEPASSLKGNPSVKCVYQFHHGAITHWVIKQPYTIVTVSASYRSKNDFQEQTSLLPVVTAGLEPACPLGNRRPSLFPWRPKRRLPIPQRDLTNCFSSPIIHTFAHYITFHQKLLPTRPIRTGKLITLLPATA